MSSFYRSHMVLRHNIIIKKLFSYSVLFAIPTHFISKYQFLFMNNDDQQQLNQAIGETDSGKKKAAPSIFFSGSLTVEAAFVLPIFLGAIFLLSGFFQVMAVCEQVNVHLCNTGRQLAAYSEAYDGTELADYYRLFYLDINKSGIDKEHIKGGYKGILLDLSEEEGLLKLSAGYRVTLEGYLIGNQSVWIKDFIYVRPWIGADMTSNKEDVASENRRVFVAVNGAVYHRSDNCTHLLLSVHLCSIEAVETMRNIYGSRYVACERCGTTAGMNVFITDTGRAWHSDRYCSGLKREYFTMQEKEALLHGLEPCIRCGGN